jgi:hypothetical protein
MPEAPEVKWVFMVAVIGGLLMMKKREPDYESTRHLGRYGQPNSPYTMGADGEMINMASVGKPAKGGIHTALKPVDSGFSNQKSAQQIMRETKKRKAEKKLYLASQGK